MNGLLRTAAAVALILVATGGRSNTLVADLSSHLIAITTGFTGSQVLLFGATEGQGDVAVVIRGPEQALIVRRKERVAGIWVNQDELSFGGVPGYYSVAVSRDLDTIAPDQVRVRHQIGTDALHLEVPSDAAPATVESFRAALLRNKQTEGLYPSEIGKVNFLGERLFRTNVTFPANVPTGTYTVEVFLFVDGAVVSAQTTPLIVSKIGIEAEIFDFAHQQAAYYGIVAVVLALVAGWLAGVIFRRI